MEIDMIKQIICPDCFHNVASISPLCARIWLHMIDILAVNNSRDIFLLDCEQSQECLRFLEESGYITTTDCTSHFKDVIRIKVHSILKDGEEEFCLLPDMHC
jgi:hypothetical protein